MALGPRWMQQQQQEQDQHHKCSTHLNPICWPANFQKSTQNITRFCRLWQKDNLNQITLKRKRERERERREREREKREGETPYHIIYTQYLYTVISYNLLRLCTDMHGISMLIVAYRIQTVQPGHHQQRSPQQCSCASDVRMLPVILPSGYLT